MGNLRNPFAYRWVLLSQRRIDGGIVAIFRFWCDGTISFYHPLHVYEEPIQMKAYF